MPTNNFNEDIQKAKKDIAQSGSSSTSSSAATGRAGQITSGNVNTGLSNSLNKSSGGADLQEARQYINSAQNQGTSTSVLNTISSNTSGSNLNDQNLEEAKQYVNKTQSKK